MWNKMKFNPNLTSDTQIDSMWIINLIVKGKIIEFMEDNKGYLHVLGLSISKDFLHRT